ncbi:hypothetical protein [Caenispirillum bisanense]|uniref:Uncharacterized protein n=1 Tax=Caenispirillum bisanense TaxID=414052 RepID=A0A286GM52_9PROT|nr:hypothetical protein [Caenispirillum bisanense]SOD96621.1 hypothetical protein SAMN05421508_1068 [Caenispirillum bisanense]
MKTDLAARVLNVVTLAAYNHGTDQRDPVAILDTMERIEAMKLDERTVAVLEAWHASNDDWATADDVFAAADKLVKEQERRRKAKAPKPPKALITY